MSKAWEGGKGDSPRKSLIERNELELRKELVSEGTSSERKKEIESILERKKFESLIGRIVIYTSLSGKDYSAKIYDIPEYPSLGNTYEPIVSLEFRDERNKLVRKERVLPKDGSSYTTTVWRRY